MRTQKLRKSLYFAELAGTYKVIALNSSNTFVMLLATSNQQPLYWDPYFFCECIACQNKLLTITLMSRSYWENTANRSASKSYQSLLEKSTALRYPSISLVPLSLITQICLTENNAQILIFCANRLIIYCGKSENEKKPFKQIPVLVLHVEI